MNRPVLFCASLVEAFAQAGLPYPEHLPESGSICRFSTNGKPRDSAGWCRVFPDGLGAVFGCFRQGTEFVWQMRDPNAPPATEIERRDVLAKLQRLQQEREQARTNGYADAATTASEIYAHVHEVDAHHRYVRRKGITPFLGAQREDGAIVLPVYDDDDALQSLQFIYGNGDKRFLPGGKVQGGRLVLGTLEEAAEAILCEGWATGCSLHEATELPVVIAFSGANLKLVGADLRRKYPDLRLVIAADLDRHGKGAEYAQAAADAVGEPVRVILPAFANDRKTGDFNDLHHDEGLEVVRRLLLPTPSFATVKLPGCDVRDGTDSTRPLTEFGNAQRVHDAHAKQLHYIPEANLWIYWDDGAWQMDKDGAKVRSLAAAVSPRIYGEGLDFLDQAHHFTKWARASQQQRVVQATVKLLADFEDVRLPMTRLDADPMLLGLDGARRVIDLTTGHERNARRADFITKTLHVHTLGNPRDAVRWQAFLAQVFQGDGELIDWFQRWCGYLLTGSTQEQIFLFAYGRGANGKSVLAELLRYLMGDYARVIAPETLTQTKRQGSGASPDLAALIGARLMVSTETEEDCVLNETLVKSMVSGDSMSARRLYSDPIEFCPVGKLLILGNHKPTVRGTDHGMWRRVRLIPFTKVFAPEEQDRHMLDKLKEEAPHIVAWMVAGCKAWQARGLADVPRVVRLCTEEYRKDQDLIGAWFDARCEHCPSSEVTIQDLYSDYASWCTDNDLKRASKLMLGHWLNEHDFKVRPSNGKRYWQGVRLRGRPAITLVSGM